MKRHEIKFIIQDKDLLKLKKRFHLETLYKPRIIKTLYFDTYNFKFFRQSEEGLTPRLKVRMRGYNDGGINNFEIKKTNSYHREKITVKNFEYSLPKLNKLIKNYDIFENLSEKLLVVYNRHYFFIKKIGRITIDENIRFFTPKSNYKLPFRIKDKVLEVKIEKNIIDKFDVEKKINLRESRFSKYCSGVNSAYNF